MNSVSDQIIREIRDVREKLSLNKERTNEMLMDIADIESALHNWTKVLDGADRDRATRLIDRLRDARHAINRIGWGSNIALPIEREGGLIDQVHRKLP